MRDRLVFLYGEDQADLLTSRLWEQIALFRAQHPDLTAVPSPQRISEKDAILITYGDMVQQPGQKPLAALAEFLPRWLNGRISAIHLLPFFPYSSDDGFSVIDYKQVNPAWGDWDDVAAIGRSFRL
ncbi:MAG TPA: sugar phosphorylase, partial [Anaerolineae bacterium]|nr:sugar phosphorylase [Anaerolineae bacterium]